MAVVDNHIARFHYDFTLGRDRQKTLHITHNYDKPKGNKCNLGSIESIYCIMLHNAVDWAQGISLKFYSSSIDDRSDEWNISTTLWVMWLCVQNHVCTCRIFRGIQGKPAAPEWWSRWWQKHSTVCIPDSHTVSCQLHWLMVKCC